MDSEIKKNILTIYNWLAITDKLEKAELIFLFGGAIIETAEKGFNLINGGYAPLIVATGCTGTFGNPEWTKPIADIFAEYLRKQGVKKECILIQNRSMNTLEDVSYTLPILEKNNIWPKSIILVTRPTHQRRARATFRKQFPYPVKLINQPCEEKHPRSIDEDDKLNKIAITCVGEYERLIKYARKGDIEEQKIPDRIHSIAEKLSEKLPRKIKF